MGRGGNRAVSEAFIAISPSIVYHQIIISKLGENNLSIEAISFCLLTILYLAGK